MMRIQNINKLGELCHFVRGPFGGSLKKSCFKDEGYAVYEQQHAIYDQFNEIRYFIDENKFQEMKRFELKSGDLIMSCSGTMGKVAIVPEGVKRGIINQALLKLTPKENLNVEFLRYWMNSPSFIEELGKHTVGAAIKNVASVKILKTIELFVPPLQEQQQIVAILEEVFEAIDQAIANIEKNIANAQELFQSKLNEIFSQRGEGWEKKILKNITTKIGSGATPRGGQASYKESGISLIRSMNVYDKGFKKRKLAFIDEEQAKKLNNVTLEKGDILLNITGASVARCCIVPENVLPARVNQHVSIIRPMQNVILSQYLHYSLISDYNKKILLGIGDQGATRQAITKNQLENFIIHYPSSQELQLQIVKGINALKDEIKSITTAFERKIENLKELKKSILQKAFVGELTRSNSIEKPKVLSLAAEPEIMCDSEIPVIELHAGIIGYAYKKHLGAGKVRTFGRVKIEKIGHMAEAYSEIDLARKPYKDAAGPNDFERLVNVMEPYALSKNYFETQKRDSGGYDFVPKSELNKLISKTIALLPEKKKNDLDKIIELIIPMRKVQVELVATVYAAWNNLLLTNVPVTNESIVYEARENWHPDKLKISRDKFFDTIEWLKFNDIIPNGKGKLVDEKTLF